MPHRHLPRVELCPTRPASLHTGRGKGCGSSPSKRQHVDAVADTRGLHQQHGALATEPRHRRPVAMPSSSVVNTTARMSGSARAALDQVGVAGVRDVADLDDARGLQYGEDLRLPGWCGHVAVIIARSEATPGSTTGSSPVAEGPPRQARQTPWWCAPFSRLLRFARNDTGVRRRRTGRARTAGPLDIGRPCRTASSSSARRQPRRAPSSRPGVR